MRDLFGWDPFPERMLAFPELPVGFAPTFEMTETKEGCVDPVGSAEVLSQGWARLTAVRGRRTPTAHPCWSPPFFW
jgi:hypothetical protein